MTPLDREELAQLLHALLDSSEYNKVKQTCEAVKDVLEHAFGYGTVAGEAEIFVVVCTLYAEHVAQLPAAADEPLARVVQKMISLLRKEDDKASRAH
jgi:hypothetical protein